MQCPLLVLLVCSLVSALPLQLPTLFNRQNLPPIDLHHSAHSSTQYVERVTRSVELLFTTSDDDEITRVWLPLGKRLYTGSGPILPLHPASAKIVNVRGLSTDETVRSKQQEVTCVVKTIVNVLRDRGQAEFEVAFQEGDGVVRLDKASSPYDLTGREVESYECF